MDVAAAYRHCEEITWSQARNFSYGIRLLPPAKRRALAAVYAFARRIDDIGDGDLPAAEKLTALAEARASIDRLPAGGSARAGPGGPGAARRPGARGPGRRRPPVPHPAGGVRRADRRVRGRRARHQLRDLRRPAALLPLRGRLHRAALARRVRHPGRGHRRPAGRRARRGAPAHQHPAGHPRGLPGRPGLPAGRGLQPVRHRAAPERLRLAGRRPQAGGPRGVRGRAGPRLVLARAAADADAGPPQRGLHRGHGRDLLPAAAEHRRRPGAVLQRRVSLSPGQKAMVAVRSLAGAALRAGRPAPRPGGPDAQERRNEPR